MTFVLFYSHRIQLHRNLRDNDRTHYSRVMGFQNFTTTSDTNRRTIDFHINMYFFTANIAAQMIVF